MKRTQKLLSALLMVVMLLTSAGLLYASLFASGGGTQSTFGSVVFEKETGIRYNNLTKEFEVFNEAGVSWIASGRYISVEGVVAASGTSSNPRPNDYELADGNKIYNIMCDISYTGTYIGEPADSSIYNTVFDADKITLQSSGILDGRGFHLKNFVVKPVSIDSKTIGTALVKTNAGTIRNLNMSNADITSQAPASVASAAAIIVGKNTGTIDSSAVYGTASNNTYQSDKYTGLYAIAAINSNRITNCTNNANLTNTATITAYAAGIASVGDGATLFSNINNGNISTTNAGHAAGIAIDAEGVDFVVRGNVNNGNINGKASASSIIDGGVELVGLSARGNANNGSIDGASKFFYYFGALSDDNVHKPGYVYGLRWDGTLNNGSGGFAIFNVDGVSWIASDESFDENGKMDGNHVAAKDSYYEIIPENGTTLDYNQRTVLFNKRFSGDDGVDVQAPSLSEGGILDGNDNKLINFPVRRCSPTSEYYSGLFEFNGGTIQNLKMDFNSTITLYSNLAYVGGVAGATYYNENAIDGQTFSQTSWIRDVELSGVIDCGKQGILGGVVGHVISHVSAISSARYPVWGSVFINKLDLSGRIVGGVFGFGNNSKGGLYHQMTSGSFNIDGNFTALLAAGGIAGATGVVFNYNNDTPLWMSGIITGKYVGYLLGQAMYPYDLVVNVSSYTERSLDASLVGNSGINVVVEAILDRDLVGIWQANTLVED